MTYSRILVPIDFSDCALNALEYAISFAKATEGKLILLYAYHIPVPAAEAAMTINTRLVDEFIKEGDDRMKGLFERYPDLDHLVESQKIEMAFATDAITSEIRESKVDLIIMGTHGASNAFDEMVGSNTLHIIRKSNKPVLAVPSEVKHFDIKEILYSYDYQSIDSKETIQPLIDFALLFGAKIHVLHITDKLDRLHTGAISEAKILEQYLKDIPHQYHMLAGEHVESEILDYIKNHGIDALAIMPRKHTIFERLFQSSVTKQLVHHSKIPMLAFHG
jgi:nucleotide-binding universal stress UspA family protein